MKFKLLLGVSALAIGAMALLAGNINEREAERVAINKAPIVADADQHKKGYGV